MADIATLNALRENYQKERKKSPNSKESIEAYHCWLEEAIPFLRNHFHETDNDFVAFLNFDFETNGYGLEKIFDQQRIIYKTLLNRIDSNETSKIISTPVTGEEIMSKKIFISHSSKDSKLIDCFIEKILRLGCGFNIEDIAYTSREDTGVRTGEDIHKFIKQNIANSDYVFFMISPNYKKSEICLNEMGAAWATERKVKPIILPEIDFDSIGWLYNVHKGMRIENPDSLDSLYEDLCEHYQIKPRVNTWNKCKKEFIDSIESHIDEKEITNIEVERIETEEELDLLDCREIFDACLFQYNDCLERLTDVQMVYNESIPKYASQLEALAKVNPSINQSRVIMRKIAGENDILSKSLEEEIPQMRENFKRAIEVGLKMREMAEVEQEEIEEERLAIKELLESMNESKQITIRNKKILDNDKVNLDKIYTKSKKRLSSNYQNMINLIEDNFILGNQLLINT